MCPVVFGPKSPQILLLAELSQDRVGTGPHWPGAAMGLGIRGFIKRGAGKGAGEGAGIPWGSSIPVPFGHSPSAEE